jgi:hypothetical protein
MDNINGNLKSHGSKNKEKHSYTLKVYTPGMKSHAERNCVLEYKVIGEKNDRDSIKKG